MKSTVRRAAGKLADAVREMNEAQRLMLVLQNAPDRYVARTRAPRLTPMTSSSPAPRVRCCTSLPPAGGTAGPGVARRASQAELPDRAELGGGQLGVDEELERVGLLVPLHQAVQGGLAELGQPAAGRVAEQARLDDVEGEGVIALGDERGGGVGEPLLAAAGQQVERGRALGWR